MYTQTTLLQQCNYINLYYVDQEINNFVRAYPQQFKPVLKKINNTTGYNCYLIELIGEFFVRKENKTINLNTNIGFPINYPNEPPIIKLQNPDFSNYRVHEYYKNQNNDDDSVIHFKSNELDTWQYHKSLVRVIQNLFNCVIFQYPFIEKLDQTKNHKTKVKVENQESQNHYQSMFVNNINKQTTSFIVEKQFSSEMVKTKNNEEDKLCAICIEKERKFIAIPCGHFSYCEICKDMVKNQCLICRQPVQNLLKVFN